MAIRRRGWRCSTGSPCWCCTSVPAGRPPNARDWRACWCDWVVRTRSGPSCWTSCGTGGLAPPRTSWTRCRPRNWHVRFGCRPDAVRPSGCAPAPSPHRPTDCLAPLSRVSRHGLACAPTSRPCTNGHQPLRRRTRQIPWRRSIPPASWRRPGRWSHADGPRRPSGTCSARLGPARAGTRMWGAPGFWWRPRDWPPREATCGSRGTGGARRAGWRRPHTLSA